MKTLQKKSLFWDVAALDPQKNAGFIIERVLAFGDKEDVKWALAFYGEEAITSVVRKSKTLDQKSLQFWCNYFNLDKSQCAKQPSIRKQSAFWKR
ncbi:MAG: hypothetical protein WC858_04395 [Parcubacteria group bacterium]